MSFMKGFGSAFHSSFENARDRRAKREDDIFRLTYQEFISKRDSREAAKAEDKKNVNTAKDLVQVYDQPAEAWVRVYEMLNNGTSETDIRNALQNGKFSVTKRGGEAEVSKEPIKPVFTEEKPAPTTSPDREMNTLFGGKGRSYERGMDRAVEKIGEIHQQSPEEVRSTLQSGPYQPDPVESPYDITYTRTGGKNDFMTLEKALYHRELARADGDMEGVQKYQQMVDAHKLADDLNTAKENNLNMFIVRDPETDVKVHVAGKRTENGISANGRFYEEIRPVMEEELKQWVKLGEEDKAISDYKLQQAEVASGYQLSSELIDIVDRNREVLTKVGVVAPAITALTREVDAAINLLGDLTNNPEAEKRVNDLEKNITQRLVSGEVKNAAEARALLDAKIKLAGYRFGKIEGQEGRDLSNFDISRLTEIVNASSDPKVFAQNLRDYMESVKNKVDAQAPGFNQFNTRIDTLKKLFDYSPKEMAVPTFDEYIEQSGMKKYYDAFYSNNLLNEKDLKTDETSGLGNIANVPQGAIELLKADPSADAIKEFNDWSTKEYGEPLAEKVLGRSTPLGRI